MNPYNGNGGRPELPAGWESRSLEEVTEIRSGQAVPSDTYVDEAAEGTLFLQGNAEFGELYPTPVKRTTAPKVMADADAVLISVRAPVGATNYSPGQVAIGRGLAAVSPGNTLDRRFLLWALRSSRTHLERQATGTTFPAITGRVLKQLRIAVPPLRDQVRIVEAIERLVGSIGLAEQRLEEAAAQLKAFRAALYDSVFRGEPAGVVPSGYAPLSELAAIQSGLAKGRADAGASEEFAYIRTANVQAGFLDLAEMKTISVTSAQQARYLLRHGDVLVLEGGDADKVGRGWIWEGQVDPCLHQNHVFAVRPNEELRSRFLAYYINAPEARRYFLRVAKQTTNLASINKTNLLALPVPRFTPDVQDALLEALERRSVAATRLADAINCLRREQSRLLQSVLDRAMRGALPNLPPEA